METSPPVMLTVAPGGVSLLAAGESSRPPANSAKSECQARSSSALRFGLDARACAALKIIIPQIHRCNSLSQPPIDSQLFHNGFQDLRARSPRCFQAEDSFGIPPEAWLLLRFGGQTSCCCSPGCCCTSAATEPWHQDHRLCWNKRNCLRYVGRQ